MKEIPKTDNYGVDFELEKNLSQIDALEINGIDELAKAIEDFAFWLDYESFFIHPLILKKLLDKYNK